ncbi:MCE family protein [Nocardioides sp. WS12]|uniref:MCE family protein n=1 Tax=Nocardioides sp. WS12 TaxID=2486272 RepID=UPI0015FC6512|nr:MCE family protein [Nocardioides sp. WS12]
MSRPPSPHARPLLGLVYIAVLTALIATSIGVYNKSMPWQDAVEVSLTTTTPGLELNPNSDVKLQGLRVGVVREVVSTGEAARVILEIDPDKVSLIPANIDAAIVPKTLFGEKYVDLRVPPQASTTPIADGGVIEQSKTSVEIGAMFSKLVPVLQALKPERLSVTLAALADALDGRGEKLAVTLTQLEQLTGELDPHMETLVYDLRQFAEVSDVYAGAADNLMRVLDASTGISTDLLVPDERSMGEFLDQALLSVKKTDQVLEENDDRIVRLAGDSRAVLALLDEYSPGLGCFLEALHTGDILANESVGSRGSFIDLTIDMVTANKPYTAPNDLPSNPLSDAHASTLPSWVPNWKPHCPEYAPWVYDLQESVESVESAKPAARPAVPDLAAAIQEAREGMARAKAARALGVHNEDVPTYAELLVLPLIADGEVRAP